MPRMTPAELAEAKKAKAAGEAAAQREAEERDEWLRGAWEKHRELVSVANGFYDEMDKLNKKWPTVSVTTRMVTRTNKLLGAIRELLEGEEDGFLDGLDDIVPAGDLPETRDVVLILREAKDALDRFAEEYKREWQGFEREARGY
jgi:hypothetical protein